MTEAVTLEMVLGFFAVLGVLATIWWRWHLSIGRVKDDLAMYKLHVAENFVTKQGQREQTQAMLEAINAIRVDIKGLNDRIDRLFERPDRE